MAGTITRGVVDGRGLEMAVGDGVALPRCSAAGVALAGVGCSNRSSCTVIGVRPLVLLLMLLFPAVDDDVDDCSAFDATTVCGVGSGRGDKINEPTDDAVATLPGVWRSLPSSPYDGALLGVVVVTADIIVLYLFACT